MELSLTDPSMFHNFYNSLPDPISAAKTFDAIGNDILPRLASLLVDYNLQHYFYICLVHKHFALHDGTERVVTVDTTDTTTISTVVNIPLPIQGVGGLPGNNSLALLQADTSVVTPEGLVGYEFSYFTHEVAQLAASAAQTVGRAFLEVWVDTLRGADANNRFGLALRRPRERSVDMLTVERCDVTNRVLYTQEVPMNTHRQDWASDLPTQWEVRTGILYVRNWCTGCRIWRCARCGETAEGPPCPHCGSMAGSY
jgi:predicted RNA-binding Zn-ribbon protein involved in translation (DUF1610 family)